MLDADYDRMSGQSSDYDDGYRAEDDEEQRGQEDDEMHEDLDPEPTSAREQARREAFREGGMRGRRAPPRREEGPLRGGRRRLPRRALLVSTL